MTMKVNRTVISAVLGAATLALGVAVAVVAPAASSKPAAAGCSASALGPLPPQALPPRVASMRSRIAAAARRCDYRALERLGNERGRGLTFSYGGTRSAAAFWRALERNGRRPRPMEALVILLRMPPATVAVDGRTVPRSRARLYVWPRAHRADATAADWRALRPLYTAAQIEQMRRAGIGYLGYRIGITPSGDWQSFVAGD